jgi:thiol-disulfide isomerase/thioredoxin
MKYITFLIFAVSLFTSACDRFDHAFKQQHQQPPISAFFDSFSDSLATNNVLGIVSFYCENYSNNGVNKSQVEFFYTELASQNYFLESTLMDTTNYPEISWRLQVNNSQKEVIIDSLIVDYLIFNESRYLFNGNQADMRNVVVELFTATWCPNCPFAEEALSNLQTQYGNRFIYFEYHILDDLQIPNNTALLSYYSGGSTLPTTIVNGNSDTITNAGPWIQNRIFNAIQPLLAEPAEVQFCFEEMEISNNSLTVKIKLDIDLAINKTYLFLKYVLIEDYDENSTNVNGDHIHNVVKFKGEVALTEYCNEDIIQFTINNIANYPADSSIVLWVQTLEPIFNPATCQIYNVIKKRIQ